MSQSKQTSSLSRYDYQIISDWVKEDGTVIDLGCGNGSLMRHLQETKNVSGYGVELDIEQLPKCIDNNVNVIQINLDEGLGHFESDSFDTVILSLTLQAMRRPQQLLKEMMRVGKQGIVTFPNFAHWRNRAQIAINGKMPESDVLPYKWYDTPNIHLCTIRDFETMCHELGFEIQTLLAARHDGRNTLGLKMFPNLFGELALCRFQKS